MIIKHASQRVGVFIDAQNLYHTAKNIYGKRVNFETILNTAVDGRALVRALAYVISSDLAEEQSFFDALTKLGIELRTKDLQVFADGSKKGDWDVGIAVDAITLASKLDAVVLVTGDGDFVPLVQYLKHAAGVQVEVLAFSNSTSNRLIEVADDFMDLAQDLRRYLIPSHRSNTRAPYRRGKYRGGASKSVS